MVHSECTFHAEYDISLKDMDLAFANFFTWIKNAPLRCEPFCESVKIHPMFTPALMGRLSFQHTTPSKSPLPVGRNHLGIAPERDTVLYVPQSLAPENIQPGQKIPLLVMFHGAGGFPEKVLPFLEEHAEQHGFLLMAPHSMLPTWDIVVGGNGPDLERLDMALAEVASRYLLDPDHLGFAGFSDGGSYALSTGITNGDIASHVIVFSGGFMSVFMQEGSPRVFISHGLIDEQLPIDTSARKHAAKLKAAGYDVELVEFNGLHIIHPPIVQMAIDFFTRDLRR
jgi:phospholipase/carboxylesterase